MAWYLVKHMDNYLYFTDVEGEPFSWKLMS